MKRIFQICFAVLCVTGATRGELAAHELSATIQAVERASNGVNITFTVSGEPDFIDVEGSPASTGVYRWEQNAQIVSVSPEVMRAFIPVFSTQDRFFRVRLLSEGVTNTLILPAEAERFFGDIWIPGFYRSPYQQIYAAGEFREATSNVIEIQELAWRLNETDPALDTTVSKLTITMGVYQGAMSDLPRNGFIPAIFPVTVFNHPNVRLAAPAGSPPDDFMSESHSIDLIGMTVI